MLLDALMMLVIFCFIQIANAKYPDFFFLPKGAVLFLPPSAVPPQSKPAPTQLKRQKDHPQQVAVMRVSHSDVKEAPYSSEFNRVAMTALGLAIYLLVRVAGREWLGEGSMAAFYILTMILVYAVKLAIDNFFLSNYNKKFCFLFAVGLNVFFFTLFVLLSTTEGIYDSTIASVMDNYQKHLEVVFRGEVNSATTSNLMALVFFCNFFFCISITPNVFKFGAFYSKTLKMLYYEEEQPKEEDKEAQAKVKAEAKQTVTQLNSYLLGMLVLLFASHRIVQGYLAESIIDALRAILLLLCTCMIGTTTRCAIQTNAASASQYIVEYFKSEE